MHRGPSGPFPGSNYTDVPKYWREIIETEAPIPLGVKAEVSSEKF